MSWDDLTCQDSGYEVLLVTLCCTQTHADTQEEADKIVRVKWTMGRKKW